MIFTGWVAWCYCFMKQNNLSVWCSTTMCQQIPAGLIEKLTWFFNFVHEHILENTIGADFSVNTDKVPLSFHMPLTWTINTQGESLVSFRTTGPEKWNSTVRKKLPLMVIFKQKTMLEEKCLPGIVVKVNGKLWMMRWWEVGLISVSPNNRADSFIFPSHFLSLTVCMLTLPMASSEWSRPPTWFLQSFQEARRSSFNHLTFLLIILLKLRCADFGRNWQWRRNILSPKLANHVCNFVQIFFCGSFKHGAMCQSVSSTKLSSRLRSQQMTVMWTLLICQSVCLGFFQHLSLTSSFSVFLLLPSSCFSVLLATFTSWTVAPYLLHALCMWSECSLFLKTGVCASSAAEPCRLKITVVTA